MNWREPDIPAKHRKLYDQGRAGKAKAAIRCNCLMCVGWESAEVEKCTATGCPLYTLRNLAAQRATDAPNRAKRRDRALASGQRPPKHAPADGHGDHLQGPISHVADIGGASPSPDPVAVAQGTPVEGHGRA
jgi:hypothetical protein